MFSVIIVSLISFLLQGDVVSGAPDIIDTGYVKYLGNRTLPNSVAYLGIPYAEPPLGDRRFRAPLPLNTRRITKAANGAVVDATQYPDFCIQGSIGQGDAGGAGSEDCLKVNIYAPVGAKRGSNLPVLVYIHGGGYIFGNPRNWPFDHWIQQSPNVVIVSVYYRLSSFGFLAVPEFVDSKLGDLNAGFLDQTQALRWVKQNIASFGGDPNKVTINGESAGGSSIELHLVANTGEKLFSAAIAQSVYRTPLPTPEQQQPLFQFYAQQAGCNAASIAQQLSCLRTASISALARAQDAASSPAFNGSAYKLFHPVIDGKIFTDYPTQSINAGKFARVPLMVGATTNETLTGGVDLPSAFTNFCPNITTSDINALVTLYPATSFASAGLQMQTASGDFSVRCARTVMATAFSKRTNAWTYRYNQRNPTTGGAGVGHAAENWMMFLGSNTGVNGSVTFTPLKPIETSFASELIAYWLSFVRAGNPNTFKLPRSPTWAPYSTAGRNRIVLQEDPDGSTTVSGSTMELEVEPETERCTVIGSQRSQEN